MGQWVDERVGRWMNGSVGGRIHVDGWVGGWMNGSVGGRIDGWVGG